MRLVGCVDGTLDLIWEGSRTGFLSLSANEYQRLNLIDLFFPTSPTLSWIPQWLCCDGHGEAGETDFIWPQTESMGSKGGIRVAGR